MKKKLCLLLALVLALLALSGCGAEQEQTVSVTLANQSGHGITSISITPSTSTEWDTELVDGTFMDGETMDRNLGTYKESEVPDTWNILVYGEDNTILYDTTVDEVDFQIKDGDYIVFDTPEEAISIIICTADEYETLYADYEAASNEDLAAGLDAEEVAALGDISGYTGCWRLDGEPFYFVINEDFEWIAINLYGEQIGPGYVVNEDENITLCMEDGTELVSLWQTSYGDLSDANGNTLSSSDYIMLLPTPEDDLNQTATFPGGFTNVTINYPIQMEAHEQPNVTNALSFNAVMEDGTAYYWYDEDGDVWYWNGYENEFISYGSDGYIDTDSGEYMENNDAGWDYSDAYYDDYDPWSDPGDGWDDYAYDDEGWGDYF